MAPSDPVTRADAAHLLRRVGFGGTESEITALTGRTRESCVDAVMGFRTGDATPLGPDLGVPSFVSRSNQWDSHTRIIEWWVDRMATLANPTVVPSSVPPVAAASPLQEKMVLFWHDHFACGQDKIFDIPVLWDQMGLFRRTGLGSFRALVRATSVHPAMLVFLDNESNVEGGIQENFARELMELYTCGVGNYTEADVVAMARAWTGHNTVGWNGQRHDATYVYRSDRHDHGQKTLFGITANWNGIAQHGGERDTIDELVDGRLRPATARFIARKLFRWFAHLAPSAQVVQDLADVFTAADMEIAPLLRAVLLHDEFWGESARYGQVKTPTEFMASLAKRTEIPTHEMGLRWHMEAMGQTLLDPPSVAGWPSGQGWLSTAAAWGKGGALRNIRWRASDLGLLAGIEHLSAAAAAQAIFDLFGLEDVSATTRTEIERWHGRARADGRWAIPVQGFLLGAMCPEFQVQ